MSLTKQSKERLLKVAEVLENLPKGRKFALRFWSNTDKASCGTTACAVGYAAMDPWFRKRGLRLVNNSHGGIALVHKGFRNWPAARQFFGLPQDSTEYLFEEFRYIRGNKSDVIRRIRKFVKNDGEIT